MKNNEDFKDRLHFHVEQLPTLPAVVPRVLALMAEDRSSAKSVAGAVGHDLVLSARVLTVANSAYYGFSREVTTLEGAVALLGFKLIRALALSLSVLNCLPRGAESQLFSPRLLWLHSLGVATAMEKITRLTNHFGDPGVSFVEGLLHDVGKIVLNHYFRKQFQDALDQAHQSDRLLAVCEEEILGFNHAEVAEVLLQRWQFPAEIVDCIAGHHRAVAASQESIPLSLMRVSNGFTQQVGLGSSGNPLPPGINREDLETLGLGSTDVTDLKLYLLEKYQDIEAFYRALF